jgi:hypothetical protein
MNGHAFQTVLEPDGERGHWLKVDKKLRQALAVSEGDTVALTVEPAKDWPEPDIPEDFQAALADAPDICEVEEHHGDGTLAMGALDQRHQEPSNPRTTRRSRHLETPVW